MAVFKFKSKKGSDFTITYTPKDLKIKDEGKLREHMVKVADLLECEGKLAKKAEDKKEEVKEVKQEVKKSEPKKDLFGKAVE